jgi:hypothetical protein
MRFALNGSPLEMSLDRNPNRIANRCRGLFRLGCAVVLSFIAVIFGGCALVPDFKHKPQYHNPFPQLSRIAILPFRNQSQEPTLSGARVTLAYYDELQSIPGFEVLPTGVVETQWSAFESNVLRRPAVTSEDFQRFAQYLGVDAVLQGAITDYHAYYPPRMTLKVNWYAAHPGYHPIPAGYGLPWGTKEEKKIPSWVRLEAERSLARKQLDTQTPALDALEVLEGVDAPSVVPESGVAPENESDATADGDVAHAVTTVAAQVLQDQEAQDVDGLPEALPSPEPAWPNDESPLPLNWPNPEGFIPAKPSKIRPEMIAQYEPIISHMKAYNGSDEDFTQSLGEYFYFRDDARLEAGKRISNAAKTL